MGRGASVIHGVHAALVTPFDDGGRIDQKALDHLVDYLVSQKVHGLALLTEAAEDPLLDPEERRHLITSVLGRVRSRKSVVVAVSAPATREAAELAKLAQAKGATGLILSPYRVPGLGYRELYRHVERITKSTELPVLLGVRPENAVDCLTPEEVATLAKHGGLKGAFVADPTTASLEPWAKRFRRRDGCGVLSASSLSYSAAAKLGAVGSVCGMAVVGPEQAARLFEAVENKDQDAIRVLEKHLAPAIDLLGPPRALDERDGVQRLAARLAQRPLEGSQLPPVAPFALLKEALRIQGHPVKSRVRTPYEPVAGELAERLRGVLKISGLTS